MLNYEICKKMKAAGFPQFVGNFQGDVIEEHSEDGDSDSCYMPTLLEMITECGSEFLSLSQHHDNGTYWKGIVRCLDYEFVGADPEEVVATLFIKMYES